MGKNGRERMTGERMTDRERRTGKGRASLEGAGKKGEGTENAEGEAEEEAGRRRVSARFVPHFLVLL